MWIVISLVLLAWIVLTFVFHKGGYVHILLLFGLAVLGVQIIAYRKTRYHQIASDDRR